MTKDDILQKIGLIIKELNEQYDFILNTREQINDLELEIFDANTGFLADHISILRKVNAQPQTAAAPQPAAAVVPSVTPPQPTPEPQPAVKTAQDEQHAQEIAAIKQTIAQINNGEVEVKPEWLQPTAPSKPPEPYTEPPVVTPTPMAAAAQVNAPVTQPTNTAPQTLNDKIAQQQNAATIANQLEQNPPADLKAAISLNDKLLFIKDLFNGYNMAYNEAIDVVNKCKDFNEADTFIQQHYAHKNQWIDKREAAERFYVLLRKRFGV
jgi:hypothetical protein